MMRLIGVLILSIPVNLLALLVVLCLMDAEPKMDMTVAVFFVVSLVLTGVGMMIWGSMGEKN